MSGRAERNPFERPFVFQHAGGSANADRRALPGIGTDVNRLMAGAVR